MSAITNQNTSIDTFRSGICQYCHKKPSSILYSTTNVNARIQFCSLKCLQIHKIKDALGQKKCVIKLIESEKKDRK